MIYELHLGDEKITGKLSELKGMAYGQPGYFEIYKVLQSKMNIEKSESRKVLLMNIEDMREAKRLRERGYSYEVLCRKFRVGEEYMRRVLRQMNTNIQHV